MPGTLLIGFRNANGTYSVVSAANPLPVTGGGGGGGSTSVTATAAAPTYVEGSSTNPLSVDLAGGLRVTGPITNTQMVALNPATTTLQTALNTLVGAANAAAWASGDSSLMSLLKAIATAAIATAPTIVVQEAPSWVHVPASSTDTAGGNANDLLDCLLVIPATTSPGAVSIEDGAGTNYTVFAGGASSVSTLIPFPIDMRNIQATTAWEITTGANVAVIAFYRPRT